MPQLKTHHLKQLSNYLHIYTDVPYDERADHLTFADEKIIQNIYNEWRGTTAHVLNCDECINEAFDRLMRQYVEQVKIHDNNF